MRRTLVAAFATVASACSLPFGPDTPTCNQQITTSAVMFVQSVPGIEYVPCVDSMAAGWEFIHPEFRRGGALFTFDSDRWGSPFLQVELAAECDLGDAELVESDESVPRYMDVVIDTAVPITIVPEGLSAETRMGADVIADFLRERHIAGKAIDVTIDQADIPTIDRITRAVESGAHVLIVGVLDAELGGARLILANASEPRPPMLAQQILEEIAEVVDPPSYRGKWFYSFDGGCATYTFNASGAGLQTIEADVEAALGFVPAEPIRRAAATAGLTLP